MICKFLCVPFLIKAQGNIFDYADSIHHAGNYPLAAIEYERVAFENESPHIKAEATVKAATCMKMQGRYDEAASLLDAVNLEQLTDLPLKYRILFQYALNTYLAHELNTSFSTWQSLCHYFPDSSKNEDVLFMKILCLNELQQWKEADTLYKQLMEKYGPSEALPNPYLEIPKLKDPDKAEKLSAYLPFTGAGLFYAGNIPEGILSIVLQAGFIAFGGYSILMKRYITGVLIGVGGYAAFYHGGVRRAKWLAERYNEKKRIQFNAAVRNQLLSVIKNGKHLKD
ncbi:MAG: tetratricopeptide repeat protein [Chitinophagaceae bacterium]|nr:MAG: tetratricopeptide repeat protein [Chitinophagaceae bacterium]